MCVRLRNWHMVKNLIVVRWVLDAKLILNKTVHRIWSYICSNCLFSDFSSDCLKANTFQSFHWALKKKVCVRVILPAWHEVCLFYFSQHYIKVVKLFSIAQTGIRCCDTNDLGKLIPVQNTIGNLWWNTWSKHSLR